MCVLLGKEGIYYFYHRHDNFPEPQSGDAIFPVEGNATFWGAGHGRSDQIFEAENTDLGQKYNELFQFVMT